MPCKREARRRHNTIAFWLSDDEKRIVEARIKIAGIPKGEYYRSAVAGQEINIVAGRYKSDRLAMALEELMRRTEDGDPEAIEDLRITLQELLRIMQQSE